MDYLNNYDCECLPGFGGQNCHECKTDLSFILFTSYKLKGILVLLSYIFLYFIWI